MKLASLITFYFLLNYGNCHEIETQTVTLGTPYIISCKVEDPQLVQGCWVETPMGNLKILWSGARWERGRLLNIDNIDLCGVKITKAIKSDEGIWKCILAIGTKEKTINEVTKIDVKVKENSFLNITEMDQGQRPMLSIERNFSSSPVRLMLFYSYVKYL